MFTSTLLYEDVLSIGMGKTINGMRIVSSDAAAAMAPRNMFELHRAATKNDDLQRLNQLCLPRWEKRVNTRTLRPERPEYALLMQVTPSANWARILNQIRIAICQEGSSSVDAFVRRMSIGIDPDDWEKLILRALAAILYYQEYSGVPLSLRPEEELGSPPHLSEFIIVDLIIPSLIENMLLIDYGIGASQSELKCPWPNWTKRVYFRLLWPSLNNLCAYVTKFVNSCRRGQLPSKRGWLNLASYFSAWSMELDSADIGLMLYYFHTHRRDISQAEYHRGLTGYTGVLQEMIAELPTRGPERLIRKLSVDVNELIPKKVRDSEFKYRLFAAAKEVAARHGLQLCAPERWYMTEPLLEVEGKDDWKSYT